jgi:hypothetical protein
VDGVYANRFPGSKERQPQKHDDQWQVTGDAYPRSNRHCGTVKSKLARMITCSTRVFTASRDGR